MKKQKFSRDLLMLAIITSFTIFIWISLDVYRTLQKPTLPKVPPEQLAPLNSALETKVLDNIVQREAFSKEELGLPESTPSASEPNE